MWTNLFKSSSSSSSSSSFDFRIGLKEGKAQWVKSPSKSPKTTVDSFWTILDNFRQF
jgi:hypothetical protein